MPSAGAADRRRSPARPPTVQPSRAKNVRWPAGCGHHVFRRARRRRPPRTGPAGAEAVGAVGRQHGEAVALPAARRRVDLEEPDGARRRRRRSSPTRRSPTHRVVVVQVRAREDRLLLDEDPMPDGVVVASSRRCASPPADDACGAGRTTSRDRLGLRSAASSAAWETWTGRRRRSAAPPARAAARSRPDSGRSRPWRRRRPCRARPCRRPPCGRSVRCTRGPAGSTSSIRLPATGRIGTTNGKTPMSTARRQPCTVSSGSSPMPRMT